MAIKDRQTKILLGLFLLSDINLTSVLFDERFQKIFDFSLNEKTRGTISGLLKEGLIEKMGPAGAEAKIPVSNDLGGAQPDERRGSTSTEVRNTVSSDYRLTEKGFYELCLKFPFFRFLKDKWDGKWRVISYEIPEKKREIRDRLRREMQGWGLGPWHRSFWLTPHPIITTLKALTAQKEEERYIQAFEADHSFGDRRVLIEKVWQITSLDKKYREMFKKWHDVLSQPADKIEKFKKVISAYIDLLRLDPGLPVELVGEKWIGFEGWNIFKEIKSILLS